MGNVATAAGLAAATSAAIKFATTTVADGATQLTARLITGNRFAVGIRGRSTYSRATAAAAGLAIGAATAIQGATASVPDRSAILAAGLGTLDGSAVARVRLHTWTRIDENERVRVRIPNHLVSTRATGTTASRRAADCIPVASCTLGAACT